MTPSGPHLAPISSGRFLEMHMYMTSALSKNDMKAIGLQMALDLLAKKEKRDSITGLRTRTQPGKPEWNKVEALTDSILSFFLSFSFYLSIIHPSIFTYLQMSYM